MELFDRKGFDATTLDEIAEAADIHKQTVLRYFPAKEDIAFAGRVRLFESFEETLARREGSVLAFWRGYIAQTSEGPGKAAELARWYDFCG
jgi:AcrR family transcriptional regulator